VEKVKVIDSVMGVVSKVLERLAEGTILEVENLVNSKD
jgi:hypothetical protein